MENKWYRGKYVKGILVVLEHILLIVTALSLIFTLIQVEKGNSPLDAGKLYEETDGYSGKLYSMSTDILLGISNQEYLKTENPDGSDRVIDLLEVEQGRRVTFEDVSGLTYRTRDLIEWSKSIPEYTSSYERSPQNNVIVCQRPDGTYRYYTYQEFMNAIDERKLILDMESYLTEEENRANEAQIFSDLNVGTLTEGYQDYYGLLGIINGKGKTLFSGIWNFNLDTAGNKYTPVGADSLLEVVNENEQWNGRLSEACQTLNQLVYFYNDIQNAQSTLKNYSEGNTNLTYVYVDKKNKSVYTNKQAYGRYKNYEETLEKIAGSPSFVLIQPQIADSRSNIKSVGEEISLWQHMVENYGTVGEDSNDFAFALSVDTNYPIADELRESSLNFKANADIMMPVLVGGVIAFILFLGGLVWLTLAAGRRPEDEELHLVPFDYWFTELAAGLVIGIELIVLSLNLSVNYGSSNETHWYIAGGILALLTAPLFLIGYLSLVRRIKGKLLWKNSLLRWLIGFSKKVWKKFMEFCQEAARHARSEVKIILIFGGFLLVQFLLMLMILSGGSVMILFLLALDIAAFVYFIKRAIGRQMILEGLKKITDGELTHKIPTEKLMGEQKTAAEYINRIGDGLDAAVENSVKNERMKTELITNVSHDIKTPLTSIINYIDLLKRENFTDPKIQGYLDVLTAKSQRLKILTEDVVEASKVSTGNITLECTNLDLVEMVNQVLGEFLEKLEERRLNMVVKLPEDPVVIHADGRRMWRVLANIFNNTAKYAMEGTRVYVDLSTEQNTALFSMKNISAAPLNFSADELTERFIRGDVARSTEGSGLGLSIAKNLTELQGGDFQIYLDGDLFKVILTFPKSPIG